MASKIDKLIENLDNPNLAKGMSDDDLSKIANKVWTGFSIDDESRCDWKKQTEEGIKVAEQIVEEKTYPWPNASNVKFPLIAISAIQFAARAYPSIVQGDKVVKAQVIGKDEDGTKAERATRISTHMSWQLLNDMLGWDEDTDKLLHCLPVVGTMFRKTYRDTLNDVNASELCMPLDVVVHMKTKNFDRCRRVTHIISLYKNEVLEREMGGIFLKKDADYMLQEDEEDLAENFLEQHRWLDLDGDGYEEPYIVTIHEESQTLVRIVPRYDQEGIKANEKGELKKICPLQYFTPFFFIPGASGKFYALGFAHLLGPINDSINTTINQLLDAGHLANVQGGFLGRGIRVKGGVVRFKPGEWKQVESNGGSIKDNIFPMPVKEPSATLFQLLGMLNDTGMKLASVSETMAGESPSQNTPATTTLAVIEQGLKVFTAIYKRVFRSLTLEFQKIHRLNGLYLDDEEYYRVLDEQQKVSRSDYETEDMDVYPVADPNMSSDAQRMALAEALMATLQMNPSAAGRLEILRQYYEAVKANNIDKILPEEEIKAMLEPKQPPPDPAALELGLKTQQAKDDQDRKQEMLPYDKRKAEAEIAEIESRTAKNLADAQDKPIQSALNTITAQVKALHDRIGLDIKQEEIQIKRGEAQDATSTAGGNAGSAAGSPPQADGGMAGPPNDTQGAEILGGVQDFSADPTVNGNNPVIEEL